MTNLDLLVELAKCPSFSAEKIEKLEMQSREVKAGHASQVSDNLKEALSIQRAYPDVCVVTSY